MVATQVDRDGRGERSVPNAFALAVTLFPGMLCLEPLSRAPQVCLKPLCLKPLCLKPLCLFKPLCLKPLCLKQVSSRQLLPHRRPQATRAHVGARASPPPARTTTYQTYQT